MPEATSSRNSRRAWATGQVQQLRELADGNTPVGVMSIKLGRSQDSIRSKAPLGGDLAGATEPVAVRRHELTAARMLVLWRARGGAGNATGPTSSSTTGSARTGTSR
jgi:hypothetical protein